LKVIGKVLLGVNIKELISNSSHQFPFLSVILLKKFKLIGLFLLYLLIHFHFLLQNYNNDNILQNKLNFYNDRQSIILFIKNIRLIMFEYNVKCSLDKLFNIFIMELVFYNTSSIHVDSAPNVDLQRVE